MTFKFQISLPNLQLLRYELVLILVNMKLVPTCNTLSFNTGRQFLQRRYLLASIRLVLGSESKRNSRDVLTCLI